MVLLYCSPIDAVGNDARGAGFLNRGEFSEDRVLQLAVGKAAS